MHAHLCFYGFTGRLIHVSPLVLALSFSGADGSLTGYVVSEGVDEAERYCESEKTIEAYQACVLYSRSYNNKMFNSYTQFLLILGGGAFTEWGSTLQGT